MAKREQLWVAKRDFTYDGQKVSKGQLMRPSGCINDHRLFGDDTRWTYRYDGDELLTCGTDGCNAQFINLGLLDRHREIIHKPERDERERARLAALGLARQSEDEGDTIGGLEVVGTRQGPGGAVPYVRHPQSTR